MQAYHRLQEYRIYMQDEAKLYSPKAPDIRFRETWSKSFTEFSFLKDMRGQCFDNFRAILYNQGLFASS